VIPATTPKSELFCRNPVPDSSAPRVRTTPTKASFDEKSDAVIWPLLTVKLLLVTLHGVVKVRFGFPTYVRCMAFTIKQSRNDVENSSPRGLTISNEFRSFLLGAFCGVA
jgi:hypothetical protein